jgi:hypothetical protein
MSNKKVIPHFLGDILIDLNEDFRGYTTGQNDRLTWRGLLSDGCETGSSYECVDFMTIMPFTMMVGPQAGLQAVCTRVLARVH